MKILAEKTVKIGAVAGIKPRCIKFNTQI